MAAESPVWWTPWHLGRVSGFRSNLVLWTIPTRRYEWSRELIVSRVRRMRKGAIVAFRQVCRGDFLIRVEVRQPTNTEFAHWWSIEKQQRLQQAENSLRAAKRKAKRLAARIQDAIRKAKPWEPSGVLAYVRKVEKRKYNPSAASSILLRPVGETRKPGSHRDNRGHH